VERKLLKLKSGVQDLHRFLYFFHNLPLNNRNALSRRHNKQKEWESEEGNGPILATIKYALL
jgi:hypothetical protein